MQGNASLSIEKTLMSVAGVLYRACKKALANGANGANGRRAAANTANGAKRSKTSH